LEAGRALWSKPKSVTEQGAQEWQLVGQHSTTGRHRLHRVLDGGGDITPRGGEIKIQRPDDRMACALNRTDTTQPKRSQACRCVSHQIPDRALRREPEGMDGASCGATGAVGVTQVELFAFDDRLLDAVEKVRTRRGRGGGAIAPSSRLDKHGVTRCFSLAPHWLGHGLQQLAHGDLHRW
jgi:hypothetical protein